MTDDERRTLVTLIGRYMKKCRARSERDKMVVLARFLNKKVDDGPENPER